MAQRVNIYDTDDYKKIYDSLTTENDKVKRMLASKQFYKDHPDLKPERKAKKQRQNYDSLSYLKELHGDKLVDMISKSNDENYNVNFKNGKITKKRASKSIVAENNDTQPENTETQPENTEMKQSEE